jgi:hypothetical protein
MDSTLRPLLDHAFSHGPAVNANAAMQAAREQAAIGGSPGRCYELMVPPDASLGWLEAAVLPRLVYHLESLGAHLPQAAGVVVALFVGDELYLMHAHELLRFAEQAFGITSETMVDRWGTGEQRTAAREPEGPPLALPPGEPR